MSAKPEGAKAKLVVLSAPSGAGKSTLAAMLLSRHQDRFELSISHTTRAPRGEGKEKEKHGVHYFFVDQDEFQTMIKSGHFLEYAQVFGKNWYGTSRKAVEPALARGKNVLFDIDVQGAASLKKSFGSECVTIFILPPSFEELEARLRKRATETEEAVDRRLKTAREELAAAPSFDHRFVNDDLEKTYDAIKTCLEKEGCL